MGGGLAGIAAAIRLLDSGHPVTLVERRPYLGGRASSFNDPGSGAEVDIGQHVFLRCCTSYIELLERLGTLPLAHIQPRLRVKVVGPGGRVAALVASPLPAPLHLLPSLLAYSHLSAREKLRALYATLGARLTNRQEPQLEEQSFHQWLKERHQSEQAINNFWDLLVLATLNDRSRGVSAAMGLMVFQEAFLKSRHGADIGYAATSLSQAVGEAARKHILQGGGRLLLGAGISGLAIEREGMVEVRLEDAETLVARWYVSALPHHALMALLPAKVADGPFFARFREISSSAIVNLHVWYDQQVMDDELVAFVGSPLQWAFNKTRMQGEDESRGQYLAISLSGADEYIHKSDQELAEAFLPQITGAFPRAREARLLHFLVTREERATFRPAPGTARLRPPAVTPISGLLLAGDWTDTGWPSTMEGAVRSGNSAAELIVRGGEE